MADNSSSNVVAILAIVIIVFLAIAGYYFFMGQGVKTTETVIANEPATPSTNVEVNTPSSGTSTTSTTTKR